MMNAVLAGMIGMPQVWIILVVVLVLFGGRKIPELMKVLEKGSKSLKMQPTRRMKIRKGKLKNQKNNNELEYL